MRQHRRQRPAQHCHCLAQSRGLTWAMGGGRASRRREPGVMSLPGTFGGPAALVGRNEVVGEGLVCDTAATAAGAGAGAAATSAAVDVGGRGCSRCCCSDLATSTKQVTPTINASTRCSPRGSPRAMEGVLWATTCGASSSQVLTTTTLLPCCAQPWLHPKQRTNVSRRATPVGGRGRKVDWSIEREQPPSKAAQLQLLSNLTRL